jgi:hypothetical protein
MQKTNYVHHAEILSLFSSFYNFHGGGGGGSSSN